VIPAFKIREIEISPGLVLAPMSGVTSAPFRRLIKQLNPGAVGYLISEFLSVEGMTRKSVRTLQMMKYYPEERPFAIQIFGYDIDRMRDAALMVQDAGVDIIDINCGCPAPKVVKRGGGCELMRQPDHLVKILSALRAAVKIPLTMKFRSGWDESSQNAIEIAKMAESEGLDAIAIHGRTRAQLYRGEADWNLIRSVSECVKIPVLGSGDVVDRASALERLNSGAKGLYIGRAALSNPYVFSEIISGKSVGLRANPQLLAKTALHLIELLQQDFPSRHCVGRVKQLVSQMSKGHSWAKELCRVYDLDSQIEILKQVQAGAFVASKSLNHLNQSESEQHAAC